MWCDSVCIQHSELLMCFLRPMIDEGCCGIVSSYFICDVFISLYPYLVKLNDPLELNTQLGTNFQPCTIIYQVTWCAQLNILFILNTYFACSGGDNNVECLPWVNTRCQGAHDKALIT